MRRAAATAIVALSLVTARPNLAAGEASLLLGSYRLVKRVEAGGRTVRPPGIVGFMTYTKTERSLTVMWKDAEGAPVSLSLIATYRVADGKYCETPVYWMQNNMGMPGLSYTPPADKKRCAEVQVDETGIAFDVPGEPERMRFTREGFVAKAADMWTDTWKRVD